MMLRGSEQTQFPPLVHIDFLQSFEVIVKRFVFPRLFHLLEIVSYLLKCWLVIRTYNIIYSWIFSVYLKLISNLFKNSNFEAIYPIYIYKRHHIEFSLCHIFAFDQQWFCSFSIHFLIKFSNKAFINHLVSPANTGHQATSVSHLVRLRAHSVVVWFVYIIYIDADILAILSIYLHIYTNR